jgi:hypothetical protein
MTLFRLAANVLLLANDGDRDNQRHSTVRGSRVSGHGFLGLATSDERALNRYHGVDEGD